MGRIPDTKMSPPRAATVAAQSLRSPIPMKWPIDLKDGRVLSIIDWHPNGSYNDIETNRCQSVEVTIRGRIFLEKDVCEQ